MGRGKVLDLRKVPQMYFCQKETFTRWRLDGSQQEFWLDEMIDSHRSASRYFIRYMMSMSISTYTHLIEL